MRHERHIEVLEVRLEQATQRYGELHDLLHPQGVPGRSRPHRPNGLPIRKHRGRARVRQLEGDVARMEAVGDVLAEQVGARIVAEALPVPLRA